MHVLDLGCVWGYFLLVLCPRGKRCGVTWQSVRNTQDTLLKERERKNPSEISVVFKGAEFQEAVRKICADVSRFIAWTCERFARGLREVWWDMVSEWRWWDKACWGESETLIDVRSHIMINSKISWSSLIIILIIIKNLFGFEEIWIQTECWDVSWCCVSLWCSYSRWITLAS